jgi:hypothetical protein
VYIDRNDSPATPCPGESYNTILCQGNGILNVGEDTFIYHGRWRNAGCPSDIAHYGATVGLAKIPRDRWGALGLFPEDEEGAVWSAPVTLPEGGCQLSLNADGADGMIVEVSDQDFNLHTGLSGSEGGRSSVASGFDCPVSWSGQGLAPVGGQTVRFRVNLKKGSPEPRLYALNLTA